MSIATTVPSITAVPTGTWSVDSAHSRVEFSVKHLGIATVRGHFADFDGSLEIGPESGSAVAHGAVRVGSIDTNEDARDAHLRSADFFDAESHPELSFRSTEIHPIEEDIFEIDGDFTMRGITRPLTLRAEVQGTEVDPWGNERVALEVTGTLNRGEWGMTFNQALGSGNMLVSDKVKLTLDISAVKQS
jgi:polyisoprenoid-binding protein YceI